jgi:hypothetical protein
VSQAGTYRITAVSDALCQGNPHNGSVIVTENTPPLVELGPDVTLDAGALYTLDAGPSMAAYLWSDASSNQALSVGTAGDYSVTVTDYNGCTAQDAIHIAVVVPLNINPGTMTIEGVSCISATQTITLGGRDQYFVVRNGGNVTLIAGQNILFLAGTRVDSGGYLHGYITPDNTYCGGLTPPIVLAPNPLTASPEEILPVVSGSAEPEITAPGEPAGEMTSTWPANPADGLSNLVKIYPNPSSGVITLELAGAAGPELKVSVTDMSGRKVFEKTIHQPRQKEQIDLERCSQGIYHVNVQIGSISTMVKLVLID